MGQEEIISFLRKNQNKEFTSTEIAENLSSPKGNVIQNLQRIRKKKSIYPFLSIKYKAVTHFRKERTGRNYSYKKRAFVYCYNPNYSAEKPKSKHL